VEHNHGRKRRDFTTDKKDYHRIVVSTATEKEEHIFFVVVGIYLSIYPSIYPSTYLSSWHHY
jgi:hypothetical protein